MHPHTTALARTPVRIACGARPFLLAAANEPLAARRARAFVRAVVRRTDLTPLLDTALLLTSEAVTRTHLRTPASADLLLKVLASPQGLRLTVHSRPAHPRPQPPAVPPPAGPAPEHADQLLAHLADAWGTESDTTGQAADEGPAGASTALWFELHTAPAQQVA